MEEACNAEENSACDQPTSPKDESLMFCCNRPVPARACGKQDECEYAKRQKPAYFLAQRLNEKSQRARIPDIETTPIPKLRSATISTGSIWWEVIAIWIISICMKCGWISQLRSLSRILWES